MTPADLQTLRTTAERSTVMMHPSDVLALLDQIDALTRERDEAVARYKTAERDLEATMRRESNLARAKWDAEDRAERAESLLSKVSEYARHDYGCSAADGPYRCRCGWDALRKEVQPATLGLTERETD